MKTSRSRVTQGQIDVITPKAFSPSLLQKFTRKYIPLTGHLEPLDHDFLLLIALRVAKYLDDGAEFHDGADGLRVELEPFLDVESRVTTLLDRPAQRLDQARVIPGVG